MRVKTLAAVIAVAATMILTGCPQGGFPGPAFTQTPTLGSLSVNSAAAGSQAITITVNGSNFQSGAVVTFNGAALTTTFVSSTQVTATVPAGTLTIAGTVQVTVSNPGTSASNSLPFTITNSAPTISSLNPNSATAGGAAFNLTVAGTGFVSGAVVQFGGTNLTTTFTSSTQLTAAVPASAIASAGTIQVTVSNPGGAVSTSATFTINNPPPTITSLNPNSATAGGAAFSMTVTGTGFVSGSVVKFGATSLTTTFNGGTQLTASVPASAITASGTIQVTVSNPGGAVSNSAAFTINNPPPTITSLNPNSATSGGAAFSMTVTGTGYINGAVVKFGTTSLTTTFNSATQLTAAVPASAIASAGTASVTVVNPSGGGTSNAATFTINPSGSDPCGGTGGATLDRIHVNLIGPGVGIGKTITLTAIGTFSDGSTQPVICPVSWSSAKPTIASVDPTSGVVTGVSGGVTSVTASVESGFFTDKAVVNVCSKCDSGIFTDYQFLVESADSRGPQWYVGHLHLSAHPGGTGTLTGVEDVNTSAAVKTNVALTGTYRIFDDGRGDMTLIPDVSSGLPAVSYRFAMFNDDAQGRIIEFDGKATARGELSEGGSTPTLVASMRFGFGMVGSSPGGSAAAMGEVGAFGTDASANIACTASTCAIDANDNGSVTTAAQLSASNFTAPDSNGRGTVTFSYMNAASQPVTQNFVYYISGAGQSHSPRLFFVETDAGNMAMGGQAENGGAFVSHNLCDFDSPTSFSLLRAPAFIPPSQDRDDFESINHWVSDGSCGGNIIDGENDLSTGNMTTGLTGGYTLSGTLGRGVVTETSAGGRTFSFYLGAGHDAFLLETSDANAAVALATPTSGTSGSLFSNTLTTTGAPWVLQVSSLTSNPAQEMYLLTTDGAGNVSGIGDIAQSGGAPQFSFAVTGSYVAPPPPNPDAMGRGQLQAGSLLFVIYGIDTQRGYVALAFLGGTIDSQP